MKIKLYYTKYMIACYFIKVNFIIKNKNIKHIFQYLRAKNAAVPA